MQCIVEQSFGTYPELGGLGLGGLEPGLGGLGLGEVRGGKGETLKPSDTQG